MTTRESGWVSCDLQVVAFLIHEGFSVTKLGKHENRAFFEFEDSVKRRDAVLGFWNKTKTVEPVAFLDSLRRARDMVAQAMRS